VGSFFLSPLFLSQSFGEREKEIKRLGGFQEYRICHPLRETFCQLLKPIFRHDIRMKKMMFPVPVSQIRLLL